MTAATASEAMPRLLAIGECMVELSADAAGGLRKGIAGDTFNTAYYARRALPEAWQVDYLTALGTDPLSDEILAFIAAAGIGTQAIRRLPDRLPGLYMVHLAEGERSFSYWRSASAARRLAEDATGFADAVASADWIVTSGITLAILEGAGRARLLEAMGAARAAGKTVVFDPNIRPRLFEDRATLRRLIGAAAEVSTLLMPSFDDEATHFGDRSVEDTLARYAATGLSRIVVKNGAAGASLLFDGARFDVPAVPAPAVVDTTGAGDSFNGSFLAALAVHGDPQRAARFAAAVAARVVAAHGAIVPHDLRP